MLTKEILKKGRFLLRYRMQASSYSTCETKIFLLLLLTNFHQASVVQLLPSPTHHPYVAIIFWSAKRCSSFETVAAVLICTVSV